jgi:hypothetical protein
MFDQIIDRLENAKPYKSAKPCISKATRASCPSCHGDSKTKLNVSLTSDDSILIYCHAGCDINTIMNSMGLDISDLYSNSKSYSSNNKKPLKDTVKGWDWWSLTSALEGLGDELTNLTISLTEHVPRSDPSRIVLADAVYAIKGLAEKYKYGRGVK